MVTPAASRPATLTQRQVDDFARGHHEEAPRLLRGARSLPPAAEARAAGSGPVEIADDEMQAIRRTGSAPARLLQRIAAATPAAAPVKDRAKAAAPSLRPPRPAA